MKKKCYHIPRISNLILIETNVRLLSSGLMLRGCHLQLRRLDPTIIKRVPKSKQKIFLSVLNVLPHKSTNISKSRQFKLYFPHNTERTHVASNQKTLQSGNLPPKTNQASLYYGFKILTGCKENIQVKDKCYINAILVKMKLCGIS